MRIENFNDQTGLNFRGFVAEEYVIDLDIEPRHHNAMGFVHGGVLCTLLDTSMARSCFFAHGEEPRAGATLEMKINFLKSTVDGRVSAYGRLVNSTRQTAYVEGRLENEAGELLARASATIMLFRSEKSETSAA